MNGFELAQRAGIDARTREAVKAIPLPKDEKELRQLFFEQPDQFREYARKMDGLTVLRLYLEWASETKRRYDALGIAEEIFWDGMKDLALWCDDYLAKHSVPGFAEWDWVGGTLRLEIFRIGRLQFAPGALHEAVVLNGENYPAGTPVLEVHIPAGEALDTDAAEAALRRAPQFFETHFQKTYPLFCCHSWLLSPSLRELLAGQSRIIRFQNLFSVCREDDSERQAEERVFGCVRDDANAYEEKTSLQRTLKQALLQGKSVGMGFGVRKI